MISLITEKDINQNVVTSKEIYEAIKRHPFLSVVKMDVYFIISKLDLKKIAEIEEEERRGRVFFSGESRKLYEIEQQMEKLFYRGGYEKLQEEAKSCTNKTNYEIIETHTSIIDNNRSETKSVLEVFSSYKDAVEYIDNNNLKWRGNSTGSVGYVLVEKRVVA